MRLAEYIAAVVYRRGFLLASYLLLAVIAALQQWSLPSGDDSYTHFNNYVIYRQSFFHLAANQDLYTQYLTEHWDFFRYSPSFALAFGLFAWLPDLAGLMLWNAFNAGVLYLAWVTLPVRDHRIGLAAGWFVTIEMLTALQNSQSNALMAGLLILAFNLLERRRVAAATLMIAVAVFTKLFALVAFGVWLLYPEKRRFLLFSALWVALIALLPLAVVSPAQLTRLYVSWSHQLAADYAGPAGLSLMGWMEAWFGFTPAKPIVALAGLAVLGWPLVFVRRYREFAFRLLVFCSILIWVVLFNHKAESSTYIIAMCGIALWFLSQESSRLNLSLALLAFVLTSLSTTEVFPRSFSVYVFAPYAVKAVPAILVWAKVTYELVSGTYRPKAALG